MEQATAAAVPAGRLRAVRRLGASTVAVTVAGVAVNALAYVAPLLGARTLTPADLGALATALALAAIASVAGLGLQTAVAVHRSHHGAVPNAGRATLATAGVTAAVLLAATPVAVWALELPVALPLLVVASTVAIVVGSRWLGELQGGQRFGRLAYGMVVLALARYAGVIAGLAAGAGVVVSVALGAMVAWLCLPVLAALARGAAGAGHLDRRAATGPAAVAEPPTKTHPDPTGARSGPDLKAREIVNAGAATLAMLAVSYADLILARDVLPAAQAGQYAVGAVLAKGALWAPGVVTIVALPMLARRSRRALLAALACVVACGVVLVGAAGLFGGFAIGLVGGAGYGGLAGLAAGFAGVGALYAVVFVFVNDEIAARVRFPAAPLWVALAGLAVAVHLVPQPTVGRVLTVSLATAAVTALVTGVVALRPRRRAGHGQGLAGGVP